MVGRSNSQRFPSVLQVRSMSVLFLKCDLIDIFALYYALKCGAGGEWKRRSKKMETTVYQLNISIFHKSLDLLISSILNNNNNSMIYLTDIAELL